MGGRFRAVTVLKPAPSLQLRAPRRPHILCEPVAAPLQAVVERQTSPAQWVGKSEGPEPHRVQALGLLVVDLAGISVPKVVEFVNRPRTV